MVTNVFKRREKKYLIDASQRQSIEGAARRFMEPDAYGRTLITSVYLDTPERSIIARSLEKPLYKEKLRMRTYGQREGAALVFLCQYGLAAARAFYGEALLAIPAFFELKKKYKGIVYKRRVRMSLMGAWALAQGASYEAAMKTYPLSAEERQDGCVRGSDPLTHRFVIPSGTNDLSICPAFPDHRRDAQIAREIEVALDRYEDLQPSAAILCWRVAWAPIDGADEPRITFDDSLCYIDLATGDPAMHPILDPAISIMEAKACGALPDWLVETLSSTHSYPQSFSKYGAAAMLAAKRNIERRPIHA